MKKELVEWVDKRMRCLLRAPRMWGSKEAVEMQMLQLLEMKWFLEGKEPERKEVRHVLDKYVEFLREKFPGVVSKPLYQHLGEDEWERFASILGEFQQRLFPAKGEPRPAAQLWVGRCGGNYGDWVACFKVGVQQFYLRRMDSDDEEGEEACLFMARAFSTALESWGVEPPTIEMRKGGEDASDEEHK